MTPSAGSTESCGSDETLGSAGVVALGVGDADGLAGVVALGAAEGTCDGGAEGEGDGVGVIDGVGDEAGAGGRATELWAGADGRPITIRALGADALVQLSPTTARTASDQLPGGTSPSVHAGVVRRPAQ
jgi:hypothetical protein